MDFESSARTEVTTLSPENRWRSVFSAIENASNKLAWLSFLIIIPMSIVVTIGVIARYAFHNPIFGLEDVETMMFMFVTFSGFAYCWLQKGHIRLELFLSKTKGRVKNLLDVLTTGCGCFVITFFLWGAIKRSIGIIQLGVGPKTLMLQLPELPFYFCIIAMGAIFALQMYASLTAALIRTIGGTEQ